MKTICIRKAQSKDLEDVEELYNQIHDLEEQNKTTTGWLRNIYPIKQTAYDALKRSDLYVLEDNDNIVGSAIINQIQGEMYAKGSWQYRALPDEVCVLHTLVISPYVKNKGYGKLFVQFYEDYAKEHGYYELRIDTNEKNKAARGLYYKLGYQEIGIIPTQFNGIPDVRLVLLEKRLK
ncbi:MULTISPECIES: GNAT family N-acetyltransferase [Coprobacillaceae]|uniref:GNAT family N-acetyltransferase n=1 Tax=Coprobacillaceae TaxID=2810280 RepID=UPI0018F54F8C|nr:MULTISPECIES: GNAT family N-acetyltransferase [Coprobacillaceae]